MEKQLFDINVDYEDDEFVIKERQKPKRENKGKSLLVDRGDFVVIDIETTGLDPNFDDIIELGAIRYDDYNPVAEFTTLVNPGYDIPSFITELTGISNDMLTDAPRIDDALPQFLSFVGDSLLLGHNANFDVNFIYDNAEILCLPAFSNDFVDSMRLSRWLYPEQRHHRLADLVKLYGINVNGAHRALADCKATADCYLYLLNYAKQKNIDVSKLKSKKRSKYYYKCDLRNINPNIDVKNPDNPLYGRHCVFTGKLEKMTRIFAAQLVTNLGGICQNSVTKETNCLIMGNLDYAKNVKDGKSNKLKKAEAYKLAGQDLEILSENVFYDMLPDDIIFLSANSSVAKAARITKKVSQSKDLFTLTKEFISQFDLDFGVDNANLDIRQLQSGKVPILMFGSRIGHAIWRGRNTKKPVLAITYNTLEQTGLDISRLPIWDIGKDKNRTYYFIMSDKLENLILAIYSVAKKGRSI